MTVAVMIGGCWCSEHNASAESWTDLRGTKTIEARMVGMWDDNVILEIPGGRRVSVKKSSLQAQSRLQADEIAAKLTAARSSEVELIRQRALESSAAAPNPLPTPDPVPAYVSVPEGLSVEATIDHTLEQLSAGHLMVSFDALPPSYRSEIDAIAKTAVAKVDPATFDAIVKTLHDIGDTIVTRQRWFKSHPRFEAMEQDSAQKAQSLFMSVAGFLRDGFDPKYISHESLRTTSMSQWLAEFDRRTAAHLAPLLKDVANKENQSEFVISEPGKDGKITVTTGDPKNPRAQQKQVYELVEGYWVPAGAKSGLDAAKKSLDAVEDGSLGGADIAMVVTAVVQPVLSPLRDASDEAEFHSAMESLLAQAGTAAAGATAMMPKDLASKFGMPSGSPFGGSGGGDPYGGGSPYGPGSGYDDGDEEVDEYSKAMETYSGN